LALALAVSAILCALPAAADEEKKTDRTYKSPARATALSILFPGIGQMYLDDWGTGCGLMGLGLAELTSIGITTQDGWPQDEATLQNDPTFMLSLMWYQNTMFYSSFAAYRDARLLIDNEGYRYPVPEETLTDLLVAPFDPDTFFEPEVALGLVGWIGVGLLVSYLVEGNLVSGGGTLFSRDRINFMGEQMHPGWGATLGELYYLSLMTPVAIGEEAFFRGLVQSGFSELMGRWGGWATASLMFGAIHAPNALLLDESRQRVRYLAIGVPFLTLSGGYLGWVYMHNRFSLKEPVALHFWYNFLLSTISFALDPDNQPFAVQVSLPF
jgi:membrane protease YdiL (CAAX protease family)